MKRLPPHVGIIGFLVSATKAALASHAREVFTFALGFIPVATPQAENANAVAINACARLLIKFRLAKTGEWHGHILSECAA